MREHLRAVIWPRQTTDNSTVKDKEGKPVYRYAIVGVLVTDRPLDLGPTTGYGPTEHIVDGSGGGLGHTLESLPKFKAVYPLGDATDVLCSLNSIVGDPCKEEENLNE